MRPTLPASSYARHDASALTQPARHNPREIQNIMALDHKKVVIHEDVITLGDTSVTALYATETYAIEAQILQHPDNTGATGVLIEQGPVSAGTAGTPIADREVSLPFVSPGYFYHLNEITVKAVTNSSKLIVRYKAIS